MAEQRYDLIFRGDIVLGQPLAEVKQRLQQLFKADAETVERLFTGRPVALKRGLDEATAEKYRKALHRAGAQVERVPARARSAESSAGRPAAQSKGLSLAPVGGALLRPDEQRRPRPVSVDVSGLTLRPAEGDLLDASERGAEESAEVAVPDFDLAEVGEDLLREGEGGAPPVMEVEPADWGLAEAGSDLLKAEERAPEAPPVAAPELDVAPPGSELGERREQSPPAAPDTSSLRLVDE